MQKSTPSSNTSTVATNPQDYLMPIADLLSDDPFLLAILGSNFKVSAEYGAKKRFSNTYSCL